MQKVWGNRSVWNIFSPYILYKVYALPHTSSEHQKVKGMTDKNKWLANIQEF